jgi:tol-pal system protein YbgF
MTIIPKRLNSLPALISLLVISVFVQSCVTIDQSEQLDTRRELNALNAMYKGVMKKVDRLDNNTGSMMDDIEETTTGFASLEVETRSSLAESNAELERFREEFGFVRGGIEESSHASEEFRDELEEIKIGLEDIVLRLARLENASKLAGQEGAATSRETGELMTSLNTKTQDNEAQLLNFGKLNASLERRISALEGKKPVKAKAGVKKTDKEPADLYELGHQNALKKNYTKASKQLKEFLGAYPKHELADKAQYWLARSYYGNDDWERAVLEFNKVIKKYPKSDRLGPATYMQGLSFLRLGSEKEAKVIFERVIDKFPDTKEAEEAGKRLKKMKLQKK